MIQFLLLNFVAHWERILEAEQAYAKMAAEKGHAQLMPEDFTKLKQLKIYFGHICDSLHLQTSWELLKHLEIVTVEEPCSVQQISSLIHGLADSIRDETLKIRCALVPPEKAKFFEQDSKNASLDDEPIFGKKVYEAFPDIRDEIKNAGTCLALELHDAAIFHFMRAAEVGLRAFMQRLAEKV